jgi:hypothetical protein
MTPASSHGPALQTPTDPDTLQAMQAVSHAVLQHTPSTQYPVTQSEAAAQALPCIFLTTHLLVASQYEAESQSAAVVHVVLQPTVPHPYGAQVLGAGAIPHAPAPSQYAAPLSTPPMQVLATHAIDVDGYAHDTLAPSHVPAQAPVPLHAVRVPRGAPVTSLHVPTLPDSLHASHEPVHARSQHTPSAQKPLVHCAPVTHALPLATASAQISTLLRYAVVAFAPPAASAAPPGSAAIAPSTRNVATLPALLHELAVGS